MIVKTNSQYSALFAEATEISRKRGWLNENNSDISSLNEYFSLIRDLASVDLKYTVLPLDEETFKINANTRNIEVPQSFKNGVGVQGDQVAEIIYFEIDRYFDSTDLNTQNIVFEWENGNNRQGLSKEYHRDLSQQDKIIFGWPLTNIITEKAGRIKFSVRFYSFNSDDEIVYSFSTKPQTITVNESMNFNITKDSDIIDVSEMIKNRLINSVNPDTEEGTAMSPKFRINIENTEADLINGAYTIKVQAYSEDSGIISYSLEKQKENEGWTNIEAQSFPSFDLTDDETYQEGQLYYIKDNKDAYVILTDKTFPEDKVIYEPFGIYEIDKAGTYRVVAHNRSGLKTAFDYSNILLIPGPTTPPEGDGTINPIILENGKQTIIVDNNIVEGKETSVYEWINSNNDNVDTRNVASYVVSAEGIYNVFVTNSRNNEDKRSESPIVYRVTNRAEWFDGAVLISGINSAEDLKVTIDNSMRYDTIEAILYKEYSSGDTEQVSEMSISAPNNIINFGKQGTGKYYAKLTAIYNGTQAEFKTEYWSLTD